MGNFQGRSLVFLCILWKKIANSSEGFYWKSNITKQNKTKHDVDANANTSMIEGLLKLHCACELASTSIYSIPFHESQK